MQFNIRRSTYNSSYRQDGIDQAMKLYSVLKGTYRTFSTRHSKRFLGVEEFPLKFCRNSCPHDKLPLLFLRFDHSKDLPLAKAKLTSFWNFLTNVGMQGPAVKKMKKSVISEGTMESQIRPQSPLVPRKESSQLECSPAFKDLKQIFDLFLSKGLDRTALSIDNNYRVHPYVCVCQEPCCNCINHSQHIHKLGLHHQNEALNEVRKNIAPESLVLQFNEGGTSLKSLVREQSQVSGQVPLSQPMIPLVDEGIKKMSVKTLKSVLGNTNTDTDAEVEEEKGTTGKKSPLDISPQTQSNRQSFQSDFTNITSRGSMLAPVIQELTNINIQDSVKPLKCKPSIRSIRRNFKEIEPAKYQNLLLEMINNPENCLLSHQSKKERVLRPKLVPNDCHAKRPKWRI